MRARTAVFGASSRPSCSLSEECHGIELVGQNLERDLTQRFRQASSGVEIGDEGRTAKSIPYLALARFHRQWIAPEVKKSHDSGREI